MAYTLCFTCHCNAVSPCGKVVSRFISAEPPLSGPPWVCGLRWRLTFFVDGGLPCLHFPELGTRLQPNFRILRISRALPSLFCGLGWPLSWAPQLVTSVNAGERMPV